MGSSNQPDEHDLAFAATLRPEADDTGFVPFDRFMALALYHPSLGFYTRNATRVGRSAGTHFYTATSLGPIFGELVLATILHQLQRHGANPSTFRFVELGAETGRTVLDGLDHPFTTVEPVGIGADLPLQGPCVVFSNELFDAQPCRRFLRAGDAWLERGVSCGPTGELTEATRPFPPAQAQALGLPADAIDAYELDLPAAAADLATRIAALPWHGLFMAFDYGKSWPELTRETPQGSARAYFEHRQSNDLLARPGRQDLTCHICWDTLSDALQKSGFSVDPVRSQEAFFVKNAAKSLAQIMAEEASGFSPRKAGLMQLLHPSALGQKFQALAAWRNSESTTP